MSAITGIMSANDQTVKFNAAIKKLKHRGEERLIDYRLGNRRLLAAELCRAGHGEDVTSKEADAPILLFSGKIQNADRLRKSLKHKDYSVLPDDRSLLLALYNEQREGFLSELEGNYAFAIYDPKRGWLIVRDLLGRMPLYICTNEETFCFASELKGIRELSADFIEFPPGSFYSSEKGFVKIKGKDRKAPVMEGERAQLDEIRQLLLRATETMVDGEESVGVYLSGGLDSSIVAALASRTKEGIDTFSVGVEGSPDIKYARICSDFIRSCHREYAYTKEEMLEVLPEVIWHLESYDVGLVRSGIANYFLARIASGRIETALSGEGADELFLGYDYLKDLSPELLKKETEKMLGSLHNTGLQRGDRISAAFGIQALTPFLDEGLIEMALHIPASVRQMEGKPEKWMLKEAFLGWIPDEIRNRKKKKFSVGAGSSQIISRVADEKISDREWEGESLTISGHPLNSKEELMYYRLFRDFFPEPACDRTVGHTRHL